MTYPEIRIRDTDPLWDVLKKIYEYAGREKFIFVLDEWDYIYHQNFITDKDKDSFTKFLSNLLKDKAYVEMAYMTGIGLAENQNTQGGFSLSGSPMTKTTGTNATNAKWKYCGRNCFNPNHFFKNRIKRM